MKTKITLLLTALIITVSSFSQKESYDTFFEQTDVFLKMFVNNGLVDYLAILPNKMQLDSLVDFIAEANIETELPAEYKKAFLINAYNILVIKGITKNYPVNSPTEIDGFSKKSNTK